MHDAIQATDDIENELDLLFAEFNVTPVAPQGVDDVTLEGLLRQLEQPDDDKSDSGTGSSSGTGSASEVSVEEPMPVPRQPRLPRIAAHFQPPPPPRVEPQVNRVPCPVCGTLVHENAINEHLDECLTLQVM